VTLCGAAFGDFGQGDARAGQQPPNGFVADSDIPHHKARRGRNHRVDAGRHGIRSAEGQANRRIRREKRSTTLRCSLHNLEPCGHRHLVAPLQRCCSVPWVRSCRDSPGRVPSFEIYLPRQLWRRQERRPTTQRTPSVGSGKVDESARLLSAVMNGLERRLQLN
jgi:hypothetical protein